MKQTVLNRHDRNSYSWNMLFSELTSEHIAIGQRLIRAHNLVIVHMGKSDTCMQKDGPLHAFPFSHITYPAYWAMNQMMRFGGDIHPARDYSRHHLVLNILIEMLQALQTDQKDLREERKQSLGFVAFGYEHVLSPDLNHAIHTLENRAQIFHPPILAGTNDYILYEPHTDLAFHFPALLEAGISLESWRHPQQKNRAIHFVSHMDSKVVISELSGVNHFRSSFSENDDVESSCVRFA